MRLLSWSNGFTILQAVAVIDFNIFQINSAQSMRYRFPMVPSPHRWITWRHSSEKIMERKKKPFNRWRCFYFIFFHEKTKRIKSAELARINIKITIKTRRVLAVLIRFAFAGAFSFQTIKLPSKVLTFYRYILIARFGCCCCCCRSISYCFVLQKPVKVVLCFCCCGYGCDRVWVHTLSKSQFHYY